ncbi:DUF2971 domain-containing protein [Pseudidiomarina gelatinasegens]|uniref:DUF2971 domain-containing protein n=1 Tax=Pseudidiomarina gelatinasegens TaxID=2487740 RepID=A0A443YVK0_9GAMM|nr:DUF2971 domain-containing protein [Pseudidiomarina gelatinasegens]RWU07928.1 DUF2971 domain-containing protein [Pseudidiomarina gelatinasegens]
MIEKQWNTDKRLLCYKYLPFNNGSLNVIRNGTLKYTHPSDFNDPFETALVFNIKRLKDYSRSSSPLNMRVAEFKGLSPAERVQNRSRWEHLLRKHLESGQFTEEILQNIGILSMSLNPTSPLMWAHYADCHRGFLVEFEFDTEIASEKDLLDMAPLEVIYSEDRPEIDLTNPDNWRDCVLTKSHEWSYEEEVRIIKNTGKGIHPYNRALFLKSVIAGARISADNYTELQKAVKEASADIERDVALYRARLSERHYKVFVPNHPITDLSSD